MVAATADIIPLCARSTAGRNSGHDGEEEKVLAAKDSVHCTGSKRRPTIQSKLLVGGESSLW